MDTLTLARKLQALLVAAVAALLVLGTVATLAVRGQQATLLAFGERDLKVATLAAGIDGNLMDQDIEYQRVLRASFALRASHPDAQSFLDEGKAQFERLVKVSERDFAEMKAVAAQGATSDNGAEAGFYRDIADRTARIDDLQTDYEKAVAEVVARVSEGRHDDAVALNRGVRAKREKAEAEIAALLAEVEKHTAESIAASTVDARRAQALFVLLVVGVAAAMAFAGTLLVRSTVRRLAEATAVADRIAAGDLTGRVPENGGDEVGGLLAAMARMQTRLADVVGSVRANAESVATASGQIAQGNADLAKRTEQSAASLQETAASMEQLGTTVSHNAESARQADASAAEAAQVARDGGEVVSRVVSTMRGIQESSTRIADIIGVIDGIAFQTNILALNAAVEAARAGEQGRGFAVVAGEVRALAQRSAEAAREIKTLIGTSVDRIGEGTTLVDEAGRTMQDVVAGIARVTDLMREISHASQEQSAGVTQVGEAVGRMDQATQQNAALVEQSAAAAESLQRQARELLTAVSTFRLPA